MGVASTGLNFPYETAEKGKIGIKEAACLQNQRVGWNGLTKPYAPACERNGDVILTILKRLFPGPATVLEIGSGTGQHGAHFTRHMEQLTWQPTDLAQNQIGIRLWVEEANQPGLKQPLVLDVDSPDWPQGAWDAVFTANTLHIVSWDQVTRLVAGAGRQLRSGGLFCVYGPFNYNGAYTSASNERFDGWLAQRNPQSAIRDFEAVCACAEAAGLTLQEDNEMPSNNRLLVWRKGEVLQ